MIRQIPKINLNFTACFLSNALACSNLLRCFSTKKTHEQLHYYEARKVMLKDFTYESFKPTITILQFISTFKEHPPKEQDHLKAVSISGRISSIRTHGKTTFIDIREEHLRLQVALKSINKDEIQYRRGDIVGIRGKPFITKKGQLSVLVQNQQDLRILSPCLWMLPDYTSSNSLKDQELRYRNKHIDLISHEESMKIIKTRSKIISCLRRQLQNLQFVQVETPMLSLSCGGAIAKPFVTYHNDHKMELFMRIAPELYLKKLLIGGMRRVFEIGKNFRNQSIDQTHNPEYTSCELYSAYSNYEDMIHLTKDLFCNIVRKVKGTAKPTLNIRGKTIDLEQEWKRIDFIGGLEQKTGVTFPTQYDSQQSQAFLNELCQKHSIACDEPRTCSRLLDKLAGHFLQNDSYDQPLILMNQPKVMSPLAKPIKERPHLTERFQLFINGWEIVNAYTELNDPSIQKINTPDDHDFVEALEYGLMPCAGWGLGIDRLVMLITETQRIQEVIIFPLLKEKELEKGEDEETESKSEQKQLHNQGHKEEQQKQVKVEHTKVKKAKKKDENIKAKIDDVHQHQD